MKNRITSLLLLVITVALFAGVLGAPRPIFRVQPREPFTPVAPFPTSVKVTLSRFASICGIGNQQGVCGPIFVTDRDKVVQIELAPDPATFETTSTTGIYREALTVGTQTFQYELTIRGVRFAGSLTPEYYLEASVSHAQATTAPLATTSKSSITSLKDLGPITLYPTRLISGANSYSNEFRIQKIEL